MILKTGDSVRYNKQQGKKRVETMAKIISIVGVRVNLENGDAIYHINS